MFDQKQKPENAGSYNLSGYTPKTDPINKQNLPSIASALEKIMNQTTEAEILSSEIRVIVNTLNPFPPLKIKEKKDDIDNQEGFVLQMFLQVNRLVELNKSLRETFKHLKDTIGE